MPQPLALWILAWLGVVSAVLAQAQEVTTFKQLEGMSPAEALKGRPTRFTGVVICYDRDWGQLYVHDGTLTRYFSPQSFADPLEPGQWVEITGKTTVVEGQAGLTNLNLGLLGRRDIPAAKRLDLPQLASDFGQWIETQGRVRMAENSRGRLGMIIHSGGQECLVYVLGSSATNDFKRLLDCEVRIRGINASKVVNGRLESASVFAPGLNEVHTLEPVPPDPSKLPVFSIDALLNRELGSWTNRLIHLNGLISAYKPGEFIVVRDPTGMIRAEVAQLTRAQPGDRVDLWGFLTVGPMTAVLKYAFFETVHPPALPTATAAPAVPLKETTSPPEVLTQVSNIMSLAREKLAQHLPVRLRGVITFADPEFHNGFFQDDGDAIYLDLTQADVRAGQWVELTGQTDPGGFAPQINNVAVRILGPTNLPAPIKVDLDDLADGQLDSHWLELSGVVRHVQVEGDHLYLSLTARKGRFKVIVPGFANQPAPTRLIDALVSVMGACTSEVSSRGQLSGITLHTPSLDYIRTLDPVPTDPFGTPVRPIVTVSTYDPTHRAARRVKVRGIVTLTLPLADFFLQDDSGGIRVSTQQTNALQIGDLVEVLAFPATGDYSPFLEESSFRRIGTGASPIAKKTTAEEILRRGESDGQLVELEAQLVQSVPRSAQPKLVLQDGPIIFTAHLAGQTPGHLLQGLEPGSVLRLTGVCAVQGGEQHEPEAFRLLLAQPKDVQLLRAPAWWTVRHALMMAGGLMLVIVAVLAWVFSLRRRVRSQTEVIRQKLEERRQFAESLAREKSLLTTLIDHLPDSVFVKDQHGRYVLTNRTHVQFHGAPARDHFVGKSACEVFPAEVAGVCDAMDRKVLSGGLGVFDQEHPVQDPAGHCRWLSTTEVPLKDDAGKVIGLVGISRDVTERKRAEEQIRKLSSAVEQSPASIVITDLTGAIEYVNPKFTQVTGYTLDEARGRNSRILKGDKTSAEEYRRLWQTITQGREWRGEFHNRRKTGETYWEYASISPIVDAGGRITHFLAVKEDITEQKQLEEKLQQAQKMEAVGQLAGGVAHDFNNILAVIMMQLGLLRHGSTLDLETREALKVLEFAATRGAGLIRQLLMFSRRSVLEIKRLDVNEVVENLLKMLRRLIDEHIELSFQDAPGLPPVEADAGMLEQVLMNLTVNARDAMPKGGRLIISTTQCEVDDEQAKQSPDARPGKFVCLSVKDTGCGMDEATLKRVFEPFFTTKEVGRGTGLGLATVQGIVSQHKGWIEVESQVGQGSTFRVYFPAAARQPEVGAEKGTNETNLLHALRGEETILLVEDEAGVRQSVAQLLQLLGYHVLEATNGREAVAQWEKEPERFALLFTDMVMPEGMTGLDLAKRFQTEKPDLKVIISSGYNAAMTAQGQPSLPGVVYLPKPYDTVTLAKAVRSCLDGDKKATA